MATYALMLVCELAIGLMEFDAERDPFEHE